MALKVLSQADNIVLEHISPFYQTVPIGPPQPDYINACAILQTTLAPLALLDRLLQVEQQFGRVRREFWGPRILDLDLLLYGDRMIDHPRLRVPHPHMTERAFVLIPLADIASDWVYPPTGQTIATLLQSVSQTGVRLMDANLAEQEC